MEIFRDFLVQTSKIIENEIAILDSSGLILACTDKKKEGQYDHKIKEINFGKEILINTTDRIYGKVIIRNRIEFYGYIDGNKKEDEKILQMFLINIQNLRKFYKEKFSKETFIQDLIFNRINISDIAIRAKELHISHLAKRQIFLINVKDEEETYTHETLRSIFPDKDKDFIILIDSKNTVLIKDLSEGENDKMKIAKTIYDTLSTEIMVVVNIYIGSNAESLKDVPQSYLDACKAKEIGSIFENNRHITDFNNLGMSRLIYELPRDLCEIFIKEVFNKDSYKEPDDETIRTILQFFENNLNVSETSRQLYVHRNTLVYRLDKIQKVTGLDIRNFDDAIVFKISMMVKKYLDKT